MLSKGSGVDLLSFLAYPLWKSPAIDDMWCLLTKELSCSHETKWIQLTICPCRIKDVWFLSTFYTVEREENVSDWQRSPLIEFSFRFDLGLQFKAEFWTLTKVTVDPLLFNSCMAKTSILSSELGHTWTSHGLGSKFWPKVIHISDIVLGLINLVRSMPLSLFILVSECRRIKIDNRVEWNLED